MLQTYEIVCEREDLSNMLKFCSQICGERSHQYLISTIEDTLPECLKFANVCALNFEKGKLFSLKRMMSDTGEILIQGITEFPLNIGITGKAIDERTIITSTYGKNDVNYHDQIDNVLKLKHLENIMVIPLLVDHRKGQIIHNETMEDNEVVGVLQLINGNISDPDFVCCYNLLD